MKNKIICGAHARTTGQPCQCKALKNGRCKLHGGMSSGPKTIEGRANIAKATKERMLNGQLEAAKTGFKAWLDAGGRERLRQVMKSRHRRNKLISANLSHLFD